MKVGRGEEGRDKYLKPKNHKKRAKENDTAEEFRRSAALFHFLRRKKYHFTPPQ